jgi:hypothetical protein
MHSLFNRNFNAFDVDDVYFSIHIQVIAYTFNNMMCMDNEEPEELLRYAALIHNSVMTATSTSTEQ